LRQENGIETMTEVLAHSSNVGEMFVADRLGAEAFYEGVRRFGFGEPTGIDLPAESGGIVHAPDSPLWSLTTFYTNAFGQGVTVTPIQLVNAVSAIANGGTLMRPYVVQEIRDDEKTTVTNPEPVRRVVRPETAKQLTDMLVQVLETEYRGKFDIPGYRVAAKTGTAEIPSPAGGYETGGGSTIASGVGFGAVEDPQFTVVVQIGRPQKSAWGGRAAGPAFRKVFQELFLLYGIPPSQPAELDGGS